jgi:hypothetical protein
LPSDDGIGLVVSLSFRRAGAGIRFRPAELGLLGSTEIGGFLLGTAVGSVPQLGKLRPWVIAGGAIAIAANLALILYAPALPLLVLRPIASLGAGLAFASTLAICSRSASPARNFGIFTGFMSAGMIVGFQLLGHVLQARSSANLSTSAERAAHVVRLLFTGYVVPTFGAILVYACSRPAIAHVSDSSATGASVAGLPIVVTHYTAVAWLSSALMAAGFVGMAWIEGSQAR